MSTAINLGLFSAPPHLFGEARESVCDWIKMEDVHVVVWMRMADVHQLDYGHATWRTKVCGLVAFMQADCWLSWTDVHKNASEHGMRWRRKGGLWTGSLCTMRIAVGVVGISTTIFSSDKIVKFLELSDEF